MLFLRDERFGQGSRSEVRQRRAVEAATEADVKKCQLICYVTEEEHACVSAQAAQRRLSLSRYMKEMPVGRGAATAPAGG